MVMLTCAKDYDVDLPVVEDIILSPYHEWHLGSSYTPLPITGYYLSKNYHVVMPIWFSREGIECRHDTRGSAGLVYVVGNR